MDPSSVLAENCGGFFLSKKKRNSSPVSIKEEVMFPGDESGILTPRQGNIVYAENVDSGIYWTVGSLRILLLATIID